MQVDPINPTLKAPGTKRLKLTCDETLSIFAFKFNLRRHTKEAEGAVRVELRKLKEQVDADAANAGSATEQLRALRDVEAGGSLRTT